MEDLLHFAGWRSYCWFRGKCEINVNSTARRSTMKIILAFCGLIGLLAITCFGQDYSITPVPANLVKDSNTTFLVDLTTLKTTADFSLGTSQLNVDTNAFQAGLGYQGTVGFSTGQNFPTNAWTLELVIQVPAAAASVDPIMLGSWEGDSSSFKFNFDLEAAWGVRSEMYCWDPADGFKAIPYAGGQHYSIQASATDRSVYVAFGVDFANQNYMASAREVSGAILDSNIVFISTPNIDTSFLSGFPTNQQAAELARRWAATRTRFATTMPSTLILGNTNVIIKALRLSNRYRSEIFTATPMLPASNSVTWLPSQLDATRTTNRTVVRTVGYGLYNDISEPVNESFLVLSNGGAPVTLQLTNVPVGLYTYYVWGQIDPRGRANLNQVWKPCPMDFQAKDAGGTVLAHGRMMLKQAFTPRRMQGFHFHLDTQPTNVTLTFQLAPAAMETAWIQKIVMFDQLSNSPNVAIKSAQYLAPGPTNQLSLITAARQQRDDAIWSTLPPLNTPLIIEGQPTLFESPPNNLPVDTWVTRAFTNLLDYQVPAHTFDPLDFLDTNNGAVFPQSNILTSVPWPGAFGDDGTGVFYSASNFPSLPSDIYNTKRAELLGDRYLTYFASIVNSRGSLWGLQNALGYFNTGDPNLGQDAALALVRFAYDWPALEMNVQEVRYSEMSPDLESGADWSYEYNRNGKMQYTGWSGFQSQWLLEAYDQVFPFIKNNQVFATEVHRYIPWVQTPQDVIKLLDNYLAFPTVRDIQRNMVDPSDNVPGYAGQVLGPNSYTAPWFDLTQLYSIVYPLNGGTYQEMYGTALPRSGSQYIGSLMVYGFDAAEGTIQQASLIQWAKANGVAVPMDLSDMTKYPTIRSAGNLLVDMWVGGGFPFMVGDSSGGPHTGRIAVSTLAAATNTLQQEFNLDGDQRIAWLLANDFGYTNGSIVSAATSQADPILYATNRVIPDWGAILEMEPAETNAVNKTSATFRLGIGEGHVHSDYLDLNLFGMGLPLAVDLACRNEGSFWSRPAASWSFLHNHALAHITDDPSGAGVQNGEPWLRAFAPPLISGSYTDSLVNAQLDRDVLLMQVGSSETFYAFDVQRLTGGVYHTWAFHGCESSNLQLNVPMAPSSTRWVDRTLEGTQFAGTSTNVLQATWTMTRNAQNIPYSFSGGGVLQTVACEQAILGAAYNPALPPVNVRATLLGRGGRHGVTREPLLRCLQLFFPISLGADNQRNPIGISCDL